MPSRPAAARPARAGAETQQSSAGQRWPGAPARGLQVQRCRISVVPAGPTPQMNELHEVRCRRVSRTVWACAAQCRAVKCGAACDKITHALTHSLTHSLTPSPLTHSSLTPHSLTHSLNHPLNHPLAPSLAHHFPVPPVPGESTLPRRGFVPRHSSAKWCVCAHVLRPGG